MNIRLDLLDKDLQENGRVWFVPQRIDGVDKAYKAISAYYEGRPSVKVSINLEREIYITDNTYNFEK